MQFIPDNLRSRNELIAIGVGSIISIAYGLITRIIFGNLGNTLGLSFFVLTPMVVGFLAVVLVPERDWEYGDSVTVPWAPCTVWVILTAIVNLEVGFCILLALPFFLLMASVGGGIAELVLRLWRHLRNRMMSIIPIFAALPYLIAPLEAMFPMQQDVRQVHSSIDIAAPPDAVWQNITNLREIGPDEQRFAIFHMLGLPRPIEARMACEQVDCVRRGQWEDGLAFNGYITDIEPGKRYWVRLEADTSQVRSTTAPLQAVGGKTFGMVDDGYEIEPLGEGRSRLHLYSTYRIKSGINAYAGLWLDFLMRDIQGYILGIEKARSERGG